MRDNASFAHEGLLISLLIPEEWEAEEISNEYIRFYAEASKDFDDYRPTMSIRRGEPAGEGDRWFEDFSAKSLEKLEDSYRCFKHLYSDRFSLSSFSDLHLAAFEWEPEEGPAFSQIQVLIYHTRYNFYLINAATIKPLADTYIPLFEQVIRSIRILPER